MYRGHQFQMRGTCTFQEQSLYSNDRRGEDLVSPSFEGCKHDGEESEPFGNRITDNVFNNLKNGLNKYNKLLWILCCVLVIIIMSSSIANKEKKFSKDVNVVIFHVKIRRKSQ